MDDSTYNKQKNSLQIVFVIFRSCLKDQAALLQEGQDNDINMKNDDKTVLAFRQYILFLCYKQLVSIYNDISNNVGYTNQDLKALRHPFQQKNLCLDDCISGRV